MKVISFENAQDLLGRDVAESCDATAWPCSPAPLATSAGQAAKIAAVLDQLGSLVVRLPMHLSDHELSVATWNLVTALMAPVPQYDTGELIYHVQVRDGESAASHYSATADSGGLHTDGTLLSRPPDFGVLLCLSSADEGGETVFVDAHALNDHLASHYADLLPIAAMAHPFATVDDSAPRQWWPLLDEVDGQLGVKYVRKYVESGWRLVTQQPPAHYQLLLDAIDSFAADELNQDAHLLERGELVLWSNHQYVHGRRAFTEGRKRRRLLRIYGAYDAGRLAWTQIRPSAAAETS